MNVTGVGGAASLEQLVALNDEMSALVRAGIPLEQGLLAVGEDMPGGIRQMAAAIGQRLRQGESLSQILSSEGGRFPPVWRAVVDAGLRSGRLSAALEGLSTTARRAAELRRSLAVAWIYPAAVLFLSYVLFVFTCVGLAPRMLYAFEDLASRSNSFLVALVWLGKWAVWWGPAVPVAVFVVVAVLWRRSGRAVAIQSSGDHQARSRLCHLSARRALREGRLATFAEMTAMMLDHNVPLASAVVLAADACGDSDLRRGARDVSDRLTRGEIFTSRDQIPAALPPLIGWLIVSGSQQSQLSKALRLTADVYRRRAYQAVVWNVTYLPIVLTAVVGGTVVLLQAMAIFGPIARLLFSLG